MADYVESLQEERRRMLAAGKTARADAVEAELRRVGALTDRGFETTDSTAPLEDAVERRRPRRPRKNADA